MEKIKDLGYSPKLKSAMEEIKVILNNYDIAACVVLYTDHKAEHLMKINTTKSVLQPEGTNGIRFKALAKDFDNNLVKQKEHMEYTVGMISCFSDVMEYMNTMMKEMYSKISGKIDIEQTKGVFISHEDSGYE